MSEENKKIERDIITEIPNSSPTIKLTKSLYEMISKSPGTAISSIAALFIVIILAITIPSIFASSQTCSCE